jgi:hypothetical protein
MTPLTKPVTRKAGPHRGRLLIVTLYPGDVIGVRHERTRKEYQVPLSWVYDTGVKMAVNAAKAEKAAKAKIKAEERARKRVSNRLQARLAKRGKA